MSRAKRGVLKYEREYRLNDDMAGDPPGDRRANRPCPLAPGCGRFEVKGGAAQPRPRGGSDRGGTDGDGSASDSWDWAHGDARR